MGEGSGPSWINPVPKCFGPDGLWAVTRSQTLQPESELWAPLQGLGGTQSLSSEGLAVHKAKGLLRLWGGPWEPSPQPPIHASGFAGDIP